MGWRRGTVIPGLYAETHYAEKKMLSYLICEKRNPFDGRAENERKRRQKQRTRFGKRLGLFLVYFPV